ncbi:plasmid maintenance system killer protein [bacterium BMS3Abin12]|nr:plasmid maintenance system killer protein [bacterium BMS3Abin12]GBE49228.1 plasmid maintenance system killer protein [bacterium BMS3Bbin13]
MIKSFRHKGLRHFFEKGRVAGVRPTHATKLRMLLTALDTATEINDMDVPGFELHPLKGNRKGQWAVSVSGNWRITFEFRDGNAYSLDYEDHH